MPKKQTCFLVCNQKSGWYSSRIFHSIASRFSSSQLLLLRHQEESVDPSLNASIPLQNSLGVHQAIQIGIHREAGELPLDDPGEPDQRTHIEEPDGPEALLGLQDFEPGVPEFALRDVQISHMMSD